MSKISKITKQLQKQYKPVLDISDVKSLEDGFVLALLKNSKYAEEVAGFSPIEISGWLKEHNITTDFDLYRSVYNNVIFIL